MTTVCQQCEDRGFDEALNYCDVCQKYAVHRYCLETSHTIFQHDVIWFCDNCQSELGKPDTVEESCPPLCEEDDLENTKLVRCTQDLKKNTPLKRLGKKKKRTKNWKWTRVKYRKRKKMLKPPTEKDDEGGQLAEDQ